MYKRGEIGQNEMFPSTKEILSDQQSASIDKRGVIGIHSQVLKTKKVLLELMACFNE